MDGRLRIQQALTRTVDRALADADGTSCPPRLSAAVRHAVFPGGARIRPRLCLSVALACAEDDRSLTDAAAVAIELLHCASLVHDDLPCFDDAAVRRGQPSVHAAYGEQLAVLAGDALIVLAFQTLGAAAANHPERLVELLALIGRGVGTPGGIVAGQAWECEPRVALSDYHCAKTGALFAAATASGAAAAGADHRPWKKLGECIGEAYQVADDIQDVACPTEEMGKPRGRDAELGRPSAVADLGLEGASRRLMNLVGEAVEAIPTCDHGEVLRALILAEAERFLPKSLARYAA